MRPQRIFPKPTRLSAFIEHYWRTAIQTVSIDGADNVWVGNFLGESLLYFCGADVAQCPEGKQTGDLIHNFTNGNIQKLTDASIDPAGNVWVANNWNIAEAVVGENPSEAITTKGGGAGIVVFYGLAEPVKTPLMGPVRTP